MMMMMMGSCLNGLRDDPSLNMLRLYSWLGKLKWNRKIVGDVCFI